MQTAADAAAVIAASIEAAATSTVHLSAAPLRPRLACVMD